MRIINKKELSKMPNGTVFMLYSPEVLDDEIHIITGKHKDRDGYNGEINLTPNFNFKDIEYDDFRVTNWCTTDSTDWEYDDNQLFAVFSKLEIQIMIQILQWALTGCDNNGMDWFEDSYFYDNNVIPEKELQEWISDTSCFGLG